MTDRGRHPRTRHGPGGAGRSADVCRYLSCGASMPRRYHREARRIRKSGLPERDSQPSPAASAPRIRPSARRPSRSDDPGDRLPATNRKYPVSTLSPPGKNSPRSRQGTSGRGYACFPCRGDVDPVAVRAIADHAMRATGAAEARVFMVKNSTSLGRHLCRLLFAQRRREKIPQ